MMLLPVYPFSRCTWFHFRKTLRVTYPRRSGTENHYGFVPQQIIIIRKIAICITMVLSACKIVAIVSHWSFLYVVGFSNVDVKLKRTSNVGLRAVRTIVNCIFC